MNAIYWTVGILAVCGAIWYWTVRWGPLRESYQKSMELKRLFRILAPPMFESAAESEQRLLKLISQGGQKYMEDARARDRAVEDLILLARTNKFTEFACRLNHASEQDLRDLYRLLSVCAAFWVKGHWVPVSALAFSDTLDYLLRNKERIAGNNCYRVAQVLETYFMSSAHGRIKEDLPELESAGQAETEQAAEAAGQTV